MSAYVKNKFIIVVLHLTATLEPPDFTKNGCKADKKCATLSILRKTFPSLMLEERLGNDVTKLLNEETLKTYAGNNNKKQNKTKKWRK